MIIQPSEPTGIMKAEIVNPKQRPRGRGNGNPTGHISRPPHHSPPPRHTNVRTQVFDSNGPEGRIRGNAHQVMEKYLALARDAFSQGDRVGAENFYQHAEHYFRLINAYNQSNGQRRPQNLSTPAEDQEENHGEDEGGMISGSEEQPPYGEGAPQP